MMQAQRISGLFRWPTHSAQNCIPGILVVCLLAFAQTGTATAGMEVRTTTADAMDAPNATERARILRQYGQLPLRFEENRGQIDVPVKYVSKGAGQTLFLTPTGAVLSLNGRGASAPSVVRMIFKGSRGAESVVGEGATETRSNYFSGNDPAAWHEGVPNFSKVRYHGVYGGIDVVYRGNEKQLEYDFVIAPRANPRDIALAFDGVVGLDIDHEGDLVLHTAAGELRQKKPTAWQMIGREQHIVQARYVRRGRREVGIALAHYDRARTLVVDPLVVFYSTYLGGSSADKALSITVDDAGNAYVAGLTQSIDFPTTNAAQPANAGSTDVFVSKINASGSALIYSTYLGGSGIDAALGIARDAGGDVYVTGHTSSSNFPVTLNALQGNLNGNMDDAFVFKLGPGGALHYSTYLGGSDIDVANAIAVDGSGNAYVTGFTCSPDFPVVNAFQPLLHGAPYGCFAGWDAFVSKLDSSGAALVYSTYFGGFGQDEGKGIAVDSQGRASITGYTWSNDLPIAGLQLSAYKGSADAFISRFTASGGLDYSTYFSGSGHDEGAAIAVDASGVLYVTGFTQSIDFPVVNAFQPNLHGPEDGFVLRASIGTPSNVFVFYASYLGGRAEDRSRAIAVDGSGNAYVTGFTASLDFPVLLAAQAALSGMQDAFIARINPAGLLAYSTFLGGNDLDDGWGIAINPGRARGTSNTFVAGTTFSSDLATNGVLQQTPQNPPDGFVAKVGYVP